jgi:hypothetical protein
MSSEMQMRGGAQVKREVWKAVCQTRREGLCSVEVEVEVEGLDKHP